ncbi:MAG: cyclase family protein [Candidatus Methanoperedens sp.]
MKRSKNDPKILDISALISEATEVYPGDPKPTITQISNSEDGSNVSLLSISTHTGTHIDPPLHLFEDKPGADRVDLKALIGWAELYDVINCKEITVDSLKNLKPTADIILLKTKNLESYLTEDAAQYIARMNPSAFGIDSLSVDPPETLKSHRILLKKGIIIVEGLRFGKIPAGCYFFICLPLKIKNGDGGPARAIIIKDFS